MRTNTTEQDFKDYVAEIKSRPGYREPVAFGICQPTFPGAEGDEIEHCHYLIINWRGNFGSAAVFQDIAGLIGNDNAADDATVKLDDEKINALSNAFAFYMDKAEGHKNVQAIQRMAAQKDSDFRLVVIYALNAHETPPVQVQCMKQAVALAQREQQVKDSAASLVVAPTLK